VKYRRFGKTNLDLSVFSLGTMRPLGSEEGFSQVVLQALSRGINHIETARGYGASEIYLGRFLSQIDRESVYLMTKLPPTPDPKVMAGWIDESLSRLGIKRIDCLALHGINTWEHLEWVQGEQGCMQAVHEAIAEGKLDHVGFSTHGSLELIQATLETGLFEFVNLHYYWSFQRHAPLLAIAHQLDMGVFIISPADKGGRLYTPPTQLQALCQPFSPLELTYRFLLSDPRITTLSIGPATVDELGPYLEIGDRPLTETEQQVLSHLEIHMRDTLGATQCHQCYQCLPCPQDINIPEVLRLRNLALAYNMVDYGQYRYGMFENAGHWFPGNKASRCTECGDCLPRCPTQLNIPQLLGETHELLKGKQGRRLWEE
jgi:predicted aldo/keto reductase-like oxidoreductase